MDFLNFTPRTQRPQIHHLSLAQEKTMKKQLLNLAIQQEVEAVFTNKKGVQDTLFLKFMYNKMLEFPLWSKRPEARVKCQELLMALPGLLRHSQKATKRDPQNKGTRQVVSKCFDMALRTKLEREDDKTEHELDIASRLCDQDQIVNSGAKLSVTSQAIMDKYDYRSIFCLIREHPSISSLPLLFQQFNRTLVHTLSIWIDAELQDPHMLKKLKTIQLLTPTLAIRAILAVSNPMKLMQNVLSLLLARPFGSWNLMQKLCAVMVDLNKTEKLLKEAHRKLGDYLYEQDIEGGTCKKVLAKVKRFAKLGDLQLLDAGNTDSDDSDPTDAPLPLWQLSAQTAVATILADSTVQPIIEEQQQQKLLQNNETIAYIHEYFLLAERHYEKTEFIELLGNEQMLTILHELLPVIYTPIAQLFSRARVGMHFHTLFKTLKRIIKAASSPGGSKRYVPVMARFTADLYSFLHESAANDDQSVEDTLSWLVSLLAFAQGETLDLHPLVEALDSTTYTHLLDELDQVVAFYNYRAELKELVQQQENKPDETDEIEEPHKNNTTIPIPTPTTPNTLPEIPRPSLTYIPLLIDDFIAIIQLHLSNKETPQNTTPIHPNKHTSSSNQLNSPPGPPIAGVSKL